MENVMKLTDLDEVALVDEMADALRTVLVKIADGYAENYGHDEEWQRMSTQLESLGIPHNKTLEQKEQRNGF